MTKPTKEEVEKRIEYIDKFIAENNGYDYSIYALKLLRESWAAYLEQMEEQKKAEKEWIAQNALWIDVCKERDQLKAENAELRTELTDMKKSDWRTDGDYPN